MIPKKKLKKIAESNKKKIGKKAIIKINVLLEEKAKEILIKASRNADFAGRKIIKEEDIKD